MGLMPSELGLGWDSQASPSKEGGKLSKTASSVSVAISQARSRHRNRQSRPVPPTSSFAQAVGVGGLRFGETSDQRDLRHVPGPGEYATGLSMGRQVSSLQRNTRAATFAAPSTVDPPPNAPPQTVDDLRRQAEQRVSQKLSAGAKVIACLMRMLDTDRNAKVSRSELERGLGALGMRLTAFEIDLFFDRYDTNKDGHLDLQELHKAVAGGNSMWDRAMNVAHQEVESQQQQEQQQQFHPSMPPSPMPPTASPRRRQGHVVGRWKLAAAESGRPVDLVEQLRSTLTRRIVRTVDCFREWDTSIDGTLSKAEFEAGVRRLGLTGVDRSTIRELFDAWDVDQSGSLTLVEFNAILRRGGHVRGKAQRVVDPGELARREAEEAAKVEKATEKLAKNLHSTLSRAADAIEKGKTRMAVGRSLNQDQEKLLKRLSRDRDSIIRLFKSWDVDNDGFINRRELHKALPVYGIVADTNIIDNLFRTMDYTRTGRVPIEHLEKALRWVAGTKRSQVLKIDLKPDVPIHEQLTEALLSHSMRIIDLFKKWDDDGDGEITKREFEKALPLVGIDLPRGDQLDALFNAFDADGSGSISFQEFFKLLKRGETAKLYAEKRRAQLQALREARDQAEDMVPLDKLKKEIMRECTRLKPLGDPTAGLLAGLNISAESEDAKSDTKSDAKS